MACRATRIVALVLLAFLCSGLVDGNCSRGLWNAIAGCESVTGTDDDGVADCEECACSMACETTSLLSAASPLVVTAYTSQPASERPRSGLGHVMYHPPQSIL